MAECALPTELRLVLPGTFAPFAEIQDPANGLSLIDEVEHPIDEPRQGRRKSARVRGSYATTPSIDDDGTYLCTVLVEGDTWAQMETRYEALRADLRLHSVYYLEEVLSGVRRRWYCDAPVGWYPDPIDGGSRRLNEREVDLRFLVQPNPSLTIV